MTKYLATAQDFLLNKLKNCFEKGDKGDTTTKTMTINAEMKAMSLDKEHVMFSFLVKKNKLSIDDFKPNDIIKGLSLPIHISFQNNFYLVLVLKFHHLMLLLMMQNKSKKQSKRMK